MVFHSPAGTPKTLYASQLPLSASEPDTWTQDNSHVSMVVATDGKSATFTCNLPLTTSPITANVHAVTPEGVAAPVAQLTFDVDPTLVTSQTIVETPPA